MKTCFTEHHVMQLVFLEVFRNVDVDDLNHFLTVQDQLHMSEGI
jgi:hypothetical protein